MTSGGDRLVSFARALEDFRLSVENTGASYTGLAQVLQAHLEDDDPGSA